MRKSPEERFWSKVNKDTVNGCWLWTGANREGEHGFFWNGEKHGYAHRFSWQLHNGSIPDGLQVLHDCPGGDNPACVNPAHLWLGTHKDNMADMVKKDRQAKGDRQGFHLYPERRPTGARNGTHTKPESRRIGELNGSAKLTEAKVIEIRRRYALGNIFIRDLAKESGVSKSLVHAIVRRKVWKHI